MSSSAAQRAQRHRWGSAASTSATVLLGCSRAPCVLCPGLQMPGQCDRALRHPKRPGKKTSSQKTVLPIWGPSLAHSPGLLCPIILGALFTMCSMGIAASGVLQKLGSLSYQISRRAEWYTFLCSRQTIGTFPGSLGEGVACKRIPGWMLSGVA